MSIASIIIIIVLLIALAVSLYFNVRFGLLILRIQDSIEESLDMLDERYESISQILEIPLFYDSNEIRSVLRDVEATRDTILQIAGSLASIDETSVQNEENEEEE